MGCSKSHGAVGVRAELFDTRGPKQPRRTWQETKTLITRTVRSLGLFKKSKQQFKLLDAFIYFSHSHFAVEDVGFRALGFGGGEFKV